MSFQANTASGTNTTTGPFASSRAFGFAAPTAPKSSAPGGNPFGSGASSTWGGTSAATPAFGQNSNPGGYGASLSAGKPGAGSFGSGNNSGSFGAGSFGTFGQQPAPPFRGWQQDSRSGNSFAPPTSAAFANSAGFGPRAGGAFEPGNPGLGGGFGQNTGGWVNSFHGGAANPTPNPFQSNGFRVPASGSNPFGKVPATATGNPFQPVAGNSADSKSHPALSPFGPRAATVNPFSTVASAYSQNPSTGTKSSGNPFQTGSTNSTVGFPKTSGFSGFSNNAFAALGSGNTGAALFQPNHWTSSSGGGGHLASPSSAPAPAGAWKFHPPSNPPTASSAVQVRQPVSEQPNRAFTAAAFAPFPNNTGKGGASSSGFTFTPSTFGLKAGSSSTAPQLSRDDPSMQTPSKAIYGCFSYPKVDSKPASVGFSFMGSGNNNAALLNSGSVSDATKPAGFAFRSAAKSTGHVPPSQPESLVALPDVNPYGAGTYGSGRVELTVKAALALEPSTTPETFAPPKTKASPTRANLGLPNRPICTPSKSNRRVLDSSNAVRVASVRSVYFKGSPSSPSMVKRCSPTGKNAASAKSDFRFRSSLFQDLSSKKRLVIRSNASTSGSSSASMSKEADRSLSLIPETAATASHGSNMRQPISPVCPVLTNPHYSTVPEYAQLQKMSSEDLAQVHGFAIRSAEYGEIEWPGVTDVRGLNLDEIVQFSESEVVVYPDDCSEAKPVVGKGLNKRAVLRLTHIYPSQPSANESSRNEDPTAAFVERLKKRTVRCGAVFLDYAQNGGVWKFEVKHF